MPSDDLFAPAQVFARVRQRLSLDGGGASVDLGDHRFDSSIAPPALAARARAAAVLVGLVAYNEEVRVLLTKRASTLKDHSGQIAFPGGKIEPTDKTPIAAALREAYEEIGLEARHVEPIGTLDPYLTGTGFKVVPVIAKVEPPFHLHINPHEVEDAFEVPFSFLMNEANHELHTREWEGRMRQFFAMPYGERHIWGATAGILRNLYERLYTTGHKD